MRAVVSARGLLLIDRLIFVETTALTTDTTNEYDRIGTPPRPFAVALQTTSKRLGARLRILSGKNRRPETEGLAFAQRKSENYLVWGATWYTRATRVP